MDRDLDALSVAEIKKLVDDCILKEQDVVDYYCNEWWDEIS